MKKFIISLMVLAAAASANAQEAFKHLGAGIEVGTAGAGINVALPVVNDHLTIKVGYNFPSIKYKMNQTLDISMIDQSINDINAQIPAADQITTKFGNNLDTEFQLKANLGSFKAMVEYYPFAKSGFHLVAGAFFGGADFIGVDAYTSTEFWSNYKAVEKQFKAINDKYTGTEGYTPIDIKTVKATVNGETWAVNEQNGRGHLGAALSVAKARPYFGLGFGRSVPNGRVAFKFDLGAWAHGEPSLTSNSKVAFDKDAPALDFGMDTIEKIKFWPVMSFGLSVRLF